MTNILGISAFYHNSAASLVVDGEMERAAQRYGRRYTVVIEDET